MALRNVCITLNNYTIDELAHLGKCDERIQYMILGHEVGESGTRHLQGYVEFTKQIKFNTVKKIISERAHLEPRMGTAVQARDYCMKDGDYWEYGTMKKQGERKDLDNIRQLAAEEGMRTVTRRGNFQQIKVAEKYLTYNEEPRDWKPTVYWLWGPTGTGKSRKARELTEKMDTYTKNDGTKWWEGYDGQEAVIIDDFRPSWWSITEMLSLLDRYEKRVEYKGGTRQFKARMIVVTSALCPEECYKNTGEAIDQLLRRIDHIQCLVTDVTVTEVGGNTSTPTSKNEYLQM